MTLHYQTPPLNCHHTLQKISKPRKQLGGVAKVHEATPPRRRLLISAPLIKPSSLITDSSLLSRHTLSFRFSKLRPLSNYNDRRVPTADCRRRLLQVTNLSAAANFWMHIHDDTRARRAHHHFSQQELFYSQLPPHQLSGERCETSRHPAKNDPEEHPEAPPTDDWLLESDFSVFGGSMSPAPRF